jgi:aconitate decarboxylase
VIFPAALAVAQDIQANGKEFIAACVVGYEVGCRVGEYLGKNHYEVRPSPYVLIQTRLI